MKKLLNNASLPLSFAGGKYSSESVNLPKGQYIVKIVATGPCIGKILKDNEVLAEVDFSSYKTLYNNLSISFILQSESDISLEVTPKREDIKVYSASLYSSLLPIGSDEYPTPTGTINITENGENIDVKQYATANVNVLPDLAIDYISTLSHEYIKPGNNEISEYPTNVDFTTEGRFRYIVDIIFNKNIDATILGDFNIDGFNYMPTITGNRLSLNISGVEEGNIIPISYKNSLILNINPICVPYQTRAYAIGITSKSSPQNVDYALALANRYEYQPLVNTGVNFYITRIYDPDFVSTLNTTKFTGVIGSTLANIDVTISGEILQLHVLAPYTTAEGDSIKIRYHGVEIYTATII